MKDNSFSKHPLIPDFLIIGAGKSGTTSLDKYLHQHPEIFIPAVKEPNFFGYEMSAVKDFEGRPEELKHYRQSVTNLEDYLKLFEAARPTQLKGETSNTYMYHPTAPARIKHYNPQMKLIAILRQPAGRLHSRYLHLARENRTPTQQFEDCLNKNTIWWKRNDLIPEGFYYRNLKTYYELFPHENIKVYLYEDFSNKPKIVLRDIYRFLGVDETFETDFTVRYNESGMIKNKFWDKVYGQKGILTKTVRALLPDQALGILKNNIFVQKQLNELRSKNLIKPKLDPQVKYKLTHEVYGEDIHQLQNLIGRDLSHWLNTSK